MPARLKTGLDTARAVTGSNRAFTPSVAVAPMLKSIGDGTARLEVPLRAGTYDFHGVPFTIKPGTVAHVNVQIKDGELVAMGEGSVGTGVRVVPPVDLPLWITGQGVELRGAEANQKFEVDLGGLFDVRFKAKKLSELATGAGAAEAAAAGASPTMSLVNRLVDLSKVSVDAQITMRGAELDLGGSRVKVDPSTTFSLKSDGQRATLKGHVGLDGFSVDQSGVRLASTSGGHADLSASLDRTADGFHVDSRLDKVHLSVDRLETSRPSPLQPGNVDRVSLGPAEISGGTFQLSTTVGLDGQSASTPQVAFAFKAKGTLSDAQVTVKDAKDIATLALAGHFDGAVELGPQGVRMDAQVHGAHVDVRDLQGALKDNTVSIDHVTADGDVRVSVAPGQLLVEGQARALDLLVTDFKTSKVGAAQADLGNTQVTGAAKFKVSAAGVEVEGRIAATATIDSAQFDTKAAGGALGASTVSGTLTQLNLGEGAPLMRVENVDARLTVQRASMDVGQAQLQGGGSVAGKGTMVLDAKGFSLEGRSQVSMALDGGRLHSSTVDLALKSGSKAELIINELRLGKTTTVKVGAGTRIDALIASGSLNVNGSKVVLASGGRAELTVKSAGLTNGKASLRGTVKLDAGVVSDTSLFENAGLKVERAKVDGRVRVAVDDVNLSNDALTFNGGKVTLDARVGKVVGAKVPGMPGWGSLQEPLALRSKEEVMGATAVQLAGLTSPPPGRPIDALRLLREGSLKVQVPLTGAIEAMGLEVLKMPPGARLSLDLAVKDGKLVTSASRASLQGGVKAMGVEFIGAELQPDGRVRAVVKIAGKVLKVPIPGVKLPLDMDGIAALATRTPTKTDGSMVKVFDLAHAQLDVTNATFGKGRLSLAGAELDLAEGAKLSLHGTPLAGELTGTVTLNGMVLARDTIALTGGAGRGNLQVKWQRDGDRLLMEGGLSQLTLDAKSVVRKGHRPGDFVELGPGKISGGTFTIDSEFALDAKGLPKTDVTEEWWRKTHFSVQSFTGLLKGLRQTTDSGTYALGPTPLDGSIGYVTDEGLTMRAKVDDIDSQITGFSMRSAGRTLDVENVRMQGHGGTLVMGRDTFMLDTKQLTWDGTVRDVTSRAGGTTLRSGQMRISGQGSVKYDSKGSLAVAGKLHVEARASGRVPVSALTSAR